MRKHRLLGLLCLLCVPMALGPLLSSFAAADDEGMSNPNEVAQNSPPATLEKPDSPAGDKNAKRFKDIDEVTKGMGTLDGLFTLYRFNPSDKKHDPEKLFAKIPSKLLGEDILFATSISRGQAAGYMWGDALIRFEVVGEQLKLVTPDLRYVRKGGDPVTEAVERTYTDEFLTAVPIVAMSPKGDVVIDMERLLKSNLADVSSMGGRIRPELSTWSKVKVFPDNVLIDVDLALAGGEGGKSVGVSYSFRRLPKLGSYSPRVADPRVGYFLTAQMDWSKKHNERDIFDRYIHRWKLEKRDPSLELSPPKEPIVFIIEKTVPIQWRRWVRNGIEEWNRAFEKIGYTGAIEVQQQTDSNEFANHDPEDARYNFLRWGVSGRAFAMGPSRADPRTGQILDADILFDDAFVRAWMYEFDVYGPTAMADVKGPGFREWMDEHPELVPAFLSEQFAAEEQDPEWQSREWLEHEMHDHGRCTCSYAAGMQRQLALAHHTLIATGYGQKKLPERIIGEAIQEIVTHEVGHTLGLRHNFKGSSWLTLDEIMRRRAETDEPTTASIMDYTPLLFFAGDDIEHVRHFTTPTIGPYDDWAIEYGYATEKGKSEAEMLKEIASRCTERELQYATDEDTQWVNSPDPLVNRYDLSDDPIAYAKSRIELVDKLMSNITEWALQDGQPRYHLTRAFNVLWSERINNLDYVSRLVGGQYFYRDNQGDPGARPPFVLVEPEKQRAALKYLGETVFTDGFFRVDPDLLNMLAPSRWSHWGSRTPSRLDFAIHENIRAMQTMSLLNLTAPVVLQRIYDAELKTNGDDKFTAAELITTLSDTVWPQLDGKRRGPFTDANPLISSIERNLQQAYLFIILSSANARPGSTMSADLQSMIRLSLRELSGKIEKTLGDSEVDFASRAHLVECKSRIDRTLDATYQAR